MFMSVLMYGLIIAIALQPNRDKMAAAAVMFTGIISVDIAYLLGLIAGHWYYIFGISVAMVVVVCLSMYRCRRLVDGLHNACIATMVVNGSDWVIYSNSVAVNDLFYEAAFVGIYLYIWFVMLGKGGADVVGRIERSRNDVRGVRHPGSPKSCGANHHKV